MNTNLISSKRIFHTGICFLSSTGLRLDIYFATSTNFEQDHNYHSLLYRSVLFHAM